jgi:hypothetical protein
MEQFLNSPTPIPLVNGNYRQKFHYKKIQTGGGDSEGGGKGTAPGGQGSSANRPGVSLNNLRAVSTSSRSRRIAFTPIQSGMVNISLYEAGADSDYELLIKEASTGEIKSGRLILEVEKGNRVMVDVVFKSVFDGALKVMAHEV